MAAITGFDKPGFSDIFSMYPKREIALPGNDITTTRESHANRCLNVGL